MGEVGEWEIGNVVSQSRWCHLEVVSQSRVSQSRWCRNQGGVTVNVVSQARWCHSQGGVTLNVVSHSKCLSIPEWSHSQGVYPFQGGVTVKVLLESRVRSQSRCLSIPVEFCRTF